MTIFGGSLTTGHPHAWRSPHSGPGVLRRPIAYHAGDEGVGERTQQAARGGA